MSDLWFPEEGVLREVILPDLEKGRPSWDRPHTEAVVYWIKMLLQSCKATFLLGLGQARRQGKRVNDVESSRNDPGIENPGMEFDAKVMVTAAYAHDWGYMSLFKGGRPASYSEIAKMKLKHMEVGAGMIRELLEGKLKRGYSQEQIERVVHLVWIHDRLGEVKEEDELLLVEADTLGGLDSGRVEPTFDEESNEKYMKELEKSRRPLFVHKVAVEAYDELLVGRREYYRRKERAGKNR